MNTNIDDKLTAKEVCDIRRASDWDHDEAVWEKCLKQNLINVSVRDEGGNAIGVGFLSGNLRHAELVDLTVHPDHRNKGVARSIIRLITKYSRDSSIKYFGVTYDKDYPWLKELYESEGFKQIDFAMWHQSSLN